MSRGSTVTIRETPVAPAAAAAAGGVRIQSETLRIETAAQLELIDLTDRVMALARTAGVNEGTMTITSLHTTCALFVNEAQQALLADIRAFLAEVVADDRPCLHNDPAHSDCRRGNAVAHLRALFLAHSVTLPISGGEAVLGKWQRVLLAELDGPQSRSLRVQILGIA